MRHFTFLTAIAALLLLGCRSEDLSTPTYGSEGPLVIYPDYKDVTVPYNIAPLNFRYAMEGARKARTTFTLDGESVTIKGTEVEWKTAKWKSFMAGSAGKTVKVDLDRQILKPLCGTGKMFCYDSPEYVKDMGTPDRYAAVCRDFATGRVKAKNLKQKQRAIFLDRDGTINKYIDFLRDIDDFELLPGVAEAVGLINASGYLAIVVTNQPVIARGEVTVEQLQEVHNKMETLLGAEGAYLDAIYYCPHHPHKGYEGEVPELKIDCDCRKPKPGMLLKAAEEFNIDLSQSWMIGDGENDIKAGKAAGCRTALIGTDDYKQNETAPTLLDAVNNILKA